MTDLKLGDKVIEGKTKIVYKLVDHPGQVLVKSKDRITAGDGAKAHDLEGKAAISTQTTSAVFEFLNEAGIETHFIRQHSDTEMIVAKCHMIPIEWVTRRLATGSFLRRHSGVKEGYRFCPPKLETFFKDDANHDPQWSHEQLVSAGLKAGTTIITSDHVARMYHMTTTIFEILERAWATQNCTLVDMKIEFGLRVDDGKIVLADVIDNDSWRLWPSGDRSLMKDKQVYREMKEVTMEGLQMIKRNFQWVATQVKSLMSGPVGRVVVVMGSAADTEHCTKIRDQCKACGVPCELRVCSAHKSTQDALDLLAEYEGAGIPTVFVAVAGRSNGLGPVLSANATWPVINCPPLSAPWAPHDIWSSLRLPSGLGCSTVISPDAAALQAAQILSLSDHMIWCKLRAKKLDAWVLLQESDMKIKAAM